MKSVSVIIPARDEERFIGQCLDSIIRSDHPKTSLDIIVIDGMSEDRTRAVVNAYINRYPFIRLLENRKKIQTFATNIGIKAAKGEIIIRMDAHAEYPPDYIPKCLMWLEKSKADCVGGILVTKPGGQSLVAEAIAATLSTPFGVGNAYFRIGVREPQSVDTVPFGCYKKDVFDKIGIFNEDLNRTDDIEFNLRLKHAAGVIVLIPDIYSYYYSRPDWFSLAKQNFGNGFWVFYSLAFVKMPFSIRHLIPFLFVLSIFGSLLLSFAYQSFLYLFALFVGLYLGVATFVSFKLSLKKGLKYFPFLLITFPVLHISYGIGSLIGILACIKTVVGRFLRIK